MIQVKLAALPCPNGAWAAHFQYGKFGIKENGAYRSAQCILTNEQAVSIIQEGRRSMSYRYGSSEQYFREDPPEEPTTQGIRFGQNFASFTRSQIMELLESNKKINPEFEADTKAELVTLGEAWEDQHKDFADNPEGNAPKTLH